MSVPKTIHHINLLVRDLESTVSQFEKLLDQQAQQHTLEQRKVNTASFTLGETHLVLVSPATTDSVVADILQEKGEGLFLLSFGVSDLDDAIETLERKQIAAPAGKERRGIDGWRIQDFTFTESLGCILQLTEQRRL